MPPRRARWCEALLLLAPLLLPACSGAPQVKLRISPANDTNDRLPCYILVRQVDPRAYVSDSYQSVASMVMTPDASVVASALVFPGATQDFILSPPPKGQLAVYVLFTYPTGNWKTLLPTTAPSQLEIKLAASQLYPPAAR